MPKTLFEIGYKFLGVIIGIVVAVAAYVLTPTVNVVEKFILSLLGIILSVVVVEFIKGNQRH